MLNGRDLQPPSHVRRSEHAKRPAQLLAALMAAGSVSHPTLAYGRQGLQTWRKLLNSQGVAPHSPILPAAAARARGPEVPSFPVGPPGAQLPQHLRRRQQTHLKATSSDAAITAVPTTHTKCINCSEWGPVQFSLEHQSGNGCKTLTKQFCATHPQV